ncbi:hypothetical protein [Salmon gill poxvirus]|nr:hypothetical protein [Salmon gill poxvirus]
MNSLLKKKEYNWDRDQHSCYYSQTIAITKAENFILQWLEDLTTRTCAVPETVGASVTRKVQNRQGADLLPRLTIPTNRVNVSGLVHHGTMACRPVLRSRRMRTFHPKVLRTEFRLGRNRMRSITQISLCHLLLRKKYGSGLKMQSTSSWDNVLCIL